MVLERYDRQGRIKGWNQEALTSTKSAVIGSGILSDLIIADMISMGFGDILRIGKSDFFEFDKINPEVYMEQREGELPCYSAAEYELDDRDVIIDATNNMRSKMISQEVAKKKGRGYFSVSSSSLGFSINKDGEKVSNHPEFFQVQDSAMSLIAGAIVSDEVRKKVMPLKEDIILPNYRYTLACGMNGINSKVIQVGAGAIGTFSALGLSLMGADLTIVDFDSIEESNLSRQFLFYDSNGRNKAETLAERLQKYSIKPISAINEKIGEDFDPRGFNYIFSCVDNNVARYHMNRAAIKYGVPIINGGSSIEGGSSITFYPGKNSCLDCQTGFKLSKSLKESQTMRAAGACFQPSLIIPNQVVAGMMLECLVASGRDMNKRLNFTSGVGIFESDIARDCYDECKLRR